MAPPGCAGDVVQVKVLEVDLVRKRIALTMRMSDEPDQAKKVGAGDTAARRPEQGKKPASRQSPSPAQPGGAMADAFARLKR